MNLNDLINKRLPKVLGFAIALAATGCAPQLDLSSNAKGMNSFARGLACGISSAFGGTKESISISVAPVALKEKFATPVKALQLTKPEAFDISAPSVAKAYVQDMVDAAMNELSPEAKSAMHSKNFYYKFVAHALLTVIYDLEPEGVWRFFQAEYVPIGRKKEQVNLIGLWLFVGLPVPEKPQRRLKPDHPQLSFCDPIAE